MSRGGRLLAGQAVLSALILIVVYVTLLRPEDGGSLAVVEAPQPSAPSGQGELDDRQQADRRPDDRARDRRGTVSTEPGLLETEQLPQPAPIVEQPTDDQYSDTLGQLRARLGAG